MKARRLLFERFGSLECTTKPFKITSDPFLTGHATNSSLENVGNVPLYSINELAFGLLVRHELKIQIYDMINKPMLFMDEIDNMYRVYNPFL